MVDTSTMPASGQDGLDSHDRPVVTADLLALVAARALEPDRLDAALRVTGLAPVDADGWQRAGSRLLPALAVLLAIAGVICLVAANWQAWGSFAKFAAGLALVTAVVVAALAAGLDHPPLAGSRVGRWLLVLAIGLIGPLLALYGQTYQTGADVHKLMFTWAALAVPWMVAARLAAAWMLVLAIVQGACLFWLTAVNGWLWLPRPIPLPTWLAGALLQAALLVAWEVAARRLPWLDARWPQRVIAFAWLAIVTAAAVLATFVSVVPWRPMAFVAWGVTLALLGVFYGLAWRWTSPVSSSRPARAFGLLPAPAAGANGPDLPILSLVLLSLTGVAAAVVAHDTHSTSATALTVLIVIGAGAWALRSLQLAAGTGGRWPS